MTYRVVGVAGCDGCVLWDLDGSFHTDHPSRGHTRRCHLRPGPAPDTVSVPRKSHLLSLLAGEPDPCDPRGVRHALAGVPAVGIAAVLAGARSFAAIAEWAAEAAERS